MINKIKDKINLPEFFKTLGFALVFATIFRSFFFQPFAIPSESMLPNLIIGDKLLVQKFSYGYSKYSFPLNMIPFSGKIVKFRQPRHGEIVVFKMPEHGNEYFIKRIIGLPGDKVAVKQGVVYVNGKPNTQEFKKMQKMNIGSYSIPVALYKETAQNKYQYWIYRLKINQNLPEDNFAEVTVPEKHYFLMGDNRNNSHDSRFADMGFIHEDKIVGNARIIFFSLNAGVYEPWNWKDNIYLNRIGNRLDKSIG